MINAIIIILRADHDMPCILMYCITSGSELLVKDFKSYTDEFPLRDPSCLPQCTTIILKDLVKMHIDDAHVDDLVAKEKVFHAQTRAQTRVADAAKALDEPIILTTSSDDQTGNIDKIAPPPLRAFATTTNQIALLPPPAKIVPPPPRAFATTTDEIALYDDLANHNELDIAKAFLRHSVEFVLPPHYTPDVMCEMCVIGVDTKKLTKTKAVLIVNFFTAQCLKDFTMHMYCTSLEPKRGLDQGADLSIRTAKKYTLPQAKSMYTIEIASCPPPTSQEQCWMISRA